MTAKSATIPAKTLPDTEVADENARQTAGCGLGRFWQTVALKSVNAIFWIAGSKDSRTVMVGTLFKGSWSFCVISPICSKYLLPSVELAQASIDSNPLTWTSLAQRRANAAYGWSGKTPLMRQFMYSTIKLSRVFSCWKESTWMWLMAQAWILFP